MRLDEKQVALWRERTPGSLKAWTETKRLIPAGHGGGMGAFSPYPIMVERAKGSRLWDVDGNEYLDLRIGDWVNIHGHCDDDVNAAIRRQQERVVQVGAPEWDLGLRFAELLVDRVPSCEKVRFFASGTDANLAAIRLARTATGRTRIAKAIGSYAGDIAAVLVEPCLTAAGMLEARGDFLQRLRDVATREGIVLIFDEVVTFPVAYGGGQAHYGVVPDLTTLGKAIGGGLPVSAVGGRADLLDLLEPDAHDGAAPLSIMATFGGNSLALAAGIATLEKLTPEAHARMNRLGETCRRLIDDLGVRHRVPLHATGLGHLVGIHWAPERCVDLPTRLRDDRERIANINLALDNAGFYQTFTGLFLMSTAITAAEVAAFLQAFEKALHDLGYVG